jgi:hypothetical protein
VHITHGVAHSSTVLGVRSDRRERTSRAPGRREPADAGDRRSPAFYATRRDVGWLVALLTLMDTAVKLLVKLL